MNFFWRPIFLILVVALILRLWGITYGFPLFLVNDEPASVLGALKMIELKTLVPTWHQEEFKTVLNYPPFTSYFYLITLVPVLALHYVLSGLPPLEEYKDIFTLDPSFLWIAARIINALMGLAVIFITYRLAKEVTVSERAGLLAAIFLGVSFYHIQLSQVVRHWMPASLLVYVSWLAALKIREASTKKPYFFAGLFAGLGMGVNTSSAIAILPALLEHFKTKSQTLTKKIFSGKAWLMIGVAVLVAALSVWLYPYGFTRGEGAVGLSGDLLKRLMFFSGRITAFDDWFWFLADYARLLIRYETTLILAALFGAWFLLRGNPFFVATVFIFSLVYLSWLYLFFNPIPRALIFILPAWSVLAGYGVDKLILRCQNFFSASRLNLFFVFGFWALVFLAYPLIIDLRYGYLASSQDTRLLARQWIQENIPAGTKILADLPYLRLWNTKEGIKELERLNPSGLRSQDRVLLKRDESRYPQPAYYFLNLHFVETNVLERRISDPEFFRAKGFDYFIVEYEYADKSDLSPQSGELISRARLFKRFSPFGAEGLDRSLDLSGEIATIYPLELFKFERFGSFVEIYEL